MKAKDENLLTILHRGRQLVIPKFQRVYSWQKSDCDLLWDGILKAGEKQDLKDYFIGSIVYVTGSNDEERIVIDGQQRLMTVILIIEALARYLIKTNYKDPEDLEFSGAELRKNYLKRDDGCVLIPSEYDKEAFEAILNGEEAVNNNYSVQLLENFKFINAKITNENFSLKKFWKGMAKLKVARITLGEKEDDPQAVFESLNATGRSLKEIDLVRNYLLIGLSVPNDEQDYVYWSKTEKNLSPIEEHFNAFIRHYLVAKTGKSAKKFANDFYMDFKEYAEIYSSKRGLMQDIYEYSKYYYDVIVKDSIVTSLDVAYKDIRELKISVVYPFLLELNVKYKEKILTKSDLEESIRLLESYIFRRAVCKLSSRSLGTTLSSIFIALRDIKVNYLKNMKDIIYFLMPSFNASAIRFPNDDTFCSALISNDAYNFRHAQYLLRKLEKHYAGKEYSMPKKWSIDHIMPNSLTEEWRNNLGSEWGNIHAKYVHSLGNLTPTGYNSEYSNKLFIDKRDTSDGYKDSIFRLTRHLGKIAEWNKDEINKRSEKLAKIAVNEIWCAPQVNKNTDYVFDINPRFLPDLKHTAVTMVTIDGNNISATSWDQENKARIGRKVRNNGLTNSWDLVLEQLIISVNQYCNDDFDKVKKYFSPIKINIGPGKGYYRFLNEANICKQKFSENKARKIIVDICNNLPFSVEINFKWKNDGAYPLKKAILRFCNDR